MDEVEEKSAMWRVPASLVRLVGLVTAEIEAEPALRAEVGTNGGRVTRAAVLRLLVSRGAASVQGTIREERKRREVAAAAAAATLAPSTTTKASKAPAGKGGRR